MKLYIHAGTHKTATSSFQRLCHENRKLLITHQIFYPDFSSILPSVNHGIIGRLIYENNIDGAKNLIKAITKKAATTNCNQILLSSELLENCLIDYNFAKSFWDVIQHGEFEATVWSYTKRNGFDYLNSLYSQLSTNKGISIDYDYASSHIVTQGYYCISDQFHPKYYVFDINRRIELLRAIIRPTALEIQSFEKFTEGFPGKSLIARIVPGNSVCIEALEKCSKLIDKLACSLSPVEIEENYLRNFLRIANNSLPEDEILIRNLIRRRLKIKSQAQRKWKDRLLAI